MLIAFLGLGLAALLLWWGFLWTVQRRLLFPAPLSAGAAAMPRDAEAVWLGGADGKSEAWLLRPDGGAGPAPLVIFTHGNGELIDYWPDAFAEARRQGVAVLLVEYPGYGRSGGAPGEASIREAVLAAYDWAVRQPGIDSSRVIAHGRSLGGGAAAILAAERPVAALVLESSFSSVRAFARGFGAPGFLVRDPFDTRTRLATISAPVLLLHGRHDEVIPTRHADALKAARPEAQLEWMDCGHNDCPPSWPRVARFLSAHGIIP